MRRLYRPAKDDAERRRGWDYMAQGLALVTARGPRSKKDSKLPLAVLIEREMRKRGIEPPEHMRTVKPPRKPGSGRRRDPAVQYVLTCGRSFDPKSVDGPGTALDKRVEFVMESIGDGEYDAFLEDCCQRPDDRFDQDGFDRAVDKLQSLTRPQIRKIIDR